MPFDYKKEYKEFYLPPRAPSIIEVPRMNYLAVRGKGDPNSEGGEYKQSIGLLYAIAFTLKMSYKGPHKIKGFFEYVVPPLEGLCVQSMHLGSYDDEPATVARMQDYLEANGYQLDLSDRRRHHEIYLSDPRKCRPDRLKTVIRHPIKKQVS